MIREGEALMAQVLSIKDKICVRILIVDDDRDASLFYETCLQEKGFRVTVYNDPIEALSDFKPNYYDLIISDIRMPRMNGFELFERIKELDSSIRVCFITAFETYYSFLEEQFPRLDVKCFIKKPVTPKELINHIMSEILSEN